MTLTLDGTDHQGDTPTDATKKYEERAVSQHQLRCHRLGRRERARSALTLLFKSADHLADTPNNATKRRRTVSRWKWAWKIHAASTRRQYQLREHRLNRGRPARTAWTLFLDGTDHLMTPITKNVRASRRRVERDARGIHTESTNCIPPPGNQRTPNTSRTDPDSGRH